MEQSSLTLRGNLENRKPLTIILFFLQSLEIAKSAVSGDATDLVCTPTLR